MTVKRSSRKKNHFKDYVFANNRLAQGGTVYVNDDTGFLVGLSSKRHQGLRPIPYPRIGIYVGTGASHSWLWLADLCEAVSCYDVSFLDEEMVRGTGLQDLDVFFIGGGDTFAVAEALDAQGADKLGRFLRDGGVYVGSCAGAYLLLHLSGSPFEPFAGFTEVKMVNVSPDLPPCVCMPTKFSSPYSGHYVIHPVRESVLLKTNQAERFHQEEGFVAPLYGGPAMMPSEQETAVAWYCGFTEDTVFLGRKDLAERFFLDKAAVVRKRYGLGTVWLFGPHCEHPHYPEANTAMVSAIYAGLGRRRQRDEKDFSRRDKGYAEFAGGLDLLTEIKKHVSNARITARGIESAQVHWLIGKKNYEPEKILVFLEEVWTRMLMLMKYRSIHGKPAELAALNEQMMTISEDLKTLHQGIQDGAEMTPVAAKLIEGLKKGSAAFLTIYFRNKLFRIPA